MTNNNELTLRKLLDNGVEDECEVFGNYHTSADLLWIDYELTEAGEKEFGAILDLPMKKVSNYPSYQIDVSNEKGFEMSDLIEKFVLAVAGCCSVSQWDAWFHETDKEDDE